MNMHRPLVKICGISEPEHARVAVEAGADLIGIVFAESHRRVGVDDAARIAGAVREADPDRRVKITGLFVNEPAEYMNAVADTVGLDVIQLSGDETPDILGRLNQPAIGSVRANSASHQQAKARFDGWRNRESKPWAVIVDTHIPGIYGGTGKVGDWELAETLARQFPVILAGGLNPENVAAAIKTVRPFAVDVSSGVETQKRKDPEKIRAFLAAARLTVNATAAIMQEEGQS